MPIPVEPAIQKIDSISAAPENKRPLGAGVVDSVIELRAYVKSKCAYAEEQENVFAAAVDLLCHGYTDS